MSIEALNCWSRMSWAVSQKSLPKLARDVQETYMRAGGDELERLWAEAHRIGGAA